MNSLDNTLDSLQTEVGATSLPRVLANDLMGICFLPHLSTSVDVETYLRTVIELHLRPEYGTP